MTLTERHVIQETAATERHVIPMEHHVTLTEHHVIQETAATEPAMEHHMILTERHVINSNPSHFRSIIITTQSHQPHPTTRMNHQETYVTAPTYRFSFLCSIQTQAATKFECKWLCTTGTEYASKLQVSKLLHGAIKISLYCWPSLCKKPTASVISQPKYCTKHKIPYQSSLQD